MKNIQNFIWLNDQAEEAAKLYTSIIKNSKTISTMPGPNNKPMGVTVELDGCQFILFNGGPQYHPTSGISFSISCQSEQEIDALWNELKKDGKVMMELNKYPWSEKYGWTEDRFGVSWQLNLSKEVRPITPTLLFAGEQQGRAEEAINLYTSQFPNSGVNFIARYEPGERGPEGKIKFASFRINGQPFSAMDSGVEMPNMFSLGVSLFVNCETQDEVDTLWENLSEGGHRDRCGWLQDKFGVAWQIIPTALGRLLGDKDRKKANNAMQAMMGMNKIVIRDLEEAYAEA
jgi:predicted 3-demethylubiquinone-9 3-methyltransferase (glyoxalase superfamily)